MIKGKHSCSILLIHDLSEEVVEGGGEVDRQTKVRGIIYENLRPSFPQAFY